MTFAALHALSNEDDPVLVISPSDHHVDNPDAFSNAISGYKHCFRWKVVALGIPPERPETGFWIHVMRKDGLGRFRTCHY